MSNLTQFAQMLAARYNGLHAGFGSVSRWTVWNEPNLEQFLKPQFDGKKIVSPAIYAKLYMAAYKGIKAGNPLAEVAVGVDLEPRPQQADQQERHRSRRPRSRACSRWRTRSCRSSPGRRIRTRRPRTSGRARARPTRPSR